MERSNIALLAAAALAVASSAAAQQPAPRGAPPADQAQQLQVSDEDVVKFADIYVDLADTQAKFEEELGNAQTEDQARELQARIQLESIEKLTRHGWTAERYVLTGEAIRANPALTERAIALIEARN